MTWSARITYQLYAIVDRLKPKLANLQNWYRRNF